MLAAARFGINTTIGIIGIGTFGINHLRCFRQMAYIGAAELVAGCDINENLVEERLKEFSFKPYTSVTEMLEKEHLDGITVVTPDHLHRQIAHLVPRKHRVLDLLGRRLGQAFGALRRVVSAPGLQRI